MSEHHLENVNLNQGLGLPGLKEVCNSADVQVAAVSNQLWTDLK